MMKRLGTLLAAAVALGGASTGAMAGVDAEDDFFGAVVPGSTIRISVSSLLDNDRAFGKTTGVRFRGVFIPKSSRTRGIQSVRLIRRPGGSDGVLVVRFRPSFTGTTRFRYTIQGIRDGRPLPKEFSKASVIFTSASPS